jgi:hypothetical protein
MAGKTFEDLVFKVIADTKSAQEGLEKIGGKVQDLNKHTLSSSTSMDKFFGKVKIGAAVAAAAIAAAATAVGVFAIKAVQAGAENEQEQRRLELTLKNVVGATDEAAAAASEYIRQLNLASGVSQSVLRPSLDQLVRTTRNLAEAQKLLGLSMDISAGTGLDNLQVATALGQAYKGNYAQLTKLKTGLSDATLATGDFNKITGELADMFKGQAETQANTFIGQLDRLKAAVADTKESIGVLLIPVFQLMLNIINKGLVPAMDRFIKYLNANPKVMKDVVIATARVINFFAEFASIVFYTADAIVKLLYWLARAVEGWGWFFNNKGMQDWGSRTAKTLEGVSGTLEKLGDKFHDFDAMKYVAGIEFKIVLPKLTGNDFSGATPGGDKVTATLAKDWNDAAKAILQAAQTIRKSLTAVLGYDLRKEIDKLSLDPLVSSLNDAKAATTEYAKAQDKLVSATKKSAEADIAYLRSMTNVTEAGKARTQALKEAVDNARDNAISAAQDTQEALQKIATAQKAYADEVISRVRSIRDAFKSATAFDLGGKAGAISAAKESLANAEKALKDAQDKFNTNVSAKVYQGVLLNTSMPIFEAEKEAVEKAKKDLAIALGKERSPYAATIEELQTALTNAYSNATELSKVSGQLAAAGFSQDFIEQIISAGPDLGVTLANQILAADVATQASMKNVYANLLDISKNGVNQLSIDLNQGAIDAMTNFVTGLKTVEDPLDKLITAITDRVNTMVTTISEAIAAALAELGKVTKITPTVIGKGAQEGSEDALNELADAEAALADANKLLYDPLSDISERTNKWVRSTLNSKKQTAALGGTAGVLSSGRYMGQAELWAANQAKTEVKVYVTNANANPADIGSAAAWGVKTSQDTAYTLAPIGSQAAE